MNKVLIIGAHPDDAELGCEGTKARLKAEGCQVETEFLGGGRGTEYDNQFDSIPLLNWVVVVEGYIRTHKPDIIFTHYEHDLNIDHRTTYQAVITAARPMSNYFVKEIYSFEVLSSTEWNCGKSFTPDVFYEITRDQVLQKWQDLTRTYPNEVRYNPHPRSCNGIEALAMYRGMQCGAKYAEAFKSVRVVKV